MPTTSHRVLNAQMAVYLYESKLANPKLCARAIARLTGIHDKTIRDVWCARTWARQTWHLDPRRWDDDEVHPGPGRPLGAKDKKPRTPRTAPTIDRLLATWERTGRYPLVDASVFE